MEFEKLERGRSLPGPQVKSSSKITFLFRSFLFLQQAEGEEDESYDDPMNVVPKTPQSS